MTGLLFCICILQSENARMAEMTSSITDTGQERLRQIQEQNSRLVRQVEAMKGKSLMAISDKKAQVTSMQDQVSRVASIAPATPNRSDAIFRGRPRHSPLVGVGHI